jgi:hypothetical protein
MYLTKLVSTANEMADTMALIKDQATAREYAPKLKVLAARLKELQDELKKALENDKPKNEDIEELGKLYQDDIEYLARRLLTEDARLKARPELQEELSKAGSTDVKSDDWLPKPKGGGGQGGMAGAQGGAGGGAQGGMGGMGGPQGGMGGMGGAQGGMGGMAGAQGGVGGGRPPG